MNIYVGNLSVGITSDKLRELFSNFGIVNSVNVITDRYSNLPRGFAFVEMPDTTEAQQAINDLNESHVDEKFITVKEARPKKEFNSYNRY